MVMAMMMVVMMVLLGRLAQEFLFLFLFVHALGLAQLTMHLKHEAATIEQREMSTSHKHQQTSN